MSLVERLDRYKLEAQLKSPRESTLVGSGVSYISLLNHLNVHFRISAAEAQGIITLDHLSLVPGQLQFNDDSKAGRRRDLLRRLRETPLLALMEHTKLLDEFVKYASFVTHRRAATAPQSQAVRLDLRNFRVFSTPGAEPRIIGHIPARGAHPRRPLDATLPLLFPVEPVVQLPEGLVPFGRASSFTPDR